MQKILRFTFMLQVFVMTLTLVGCGGGNNKNDGNEITDMALMEFRDALIASTNWVIEGGSDVIKSFRTERNGDVLSEGNYMGMVYWSRTTDQYFSPHWEGSLLKGKSSQELEGIPPQDREWKEGVGSTIHGRSFDEYVADTLTSLFNVLAGGGSLGEFPEMEYTIENNVLTFTAKYSRMTERATVRLGGSTVTIPQYVLDNATL